MTHSTPATPHIGDHVRHFGSKHHYEVVEIYWGRLGNTIVAYRLHEDGLPVGSKVYLNQDSVRVIAKQVQL